MLLEIYHFRRILSFNRHSLPVEFVTLWVLSVEHLSEGLEAVLCLGRELGATLVGEDLVLPQQRKQNGLHIERVLNKAHTLHLLGGNHCENCLLYTSPSPRD